MEDSKCHRLLSLFLLEADAARKLVMPVICGILLFRTLVARQVTKLPVNKVPDRRKQHAVYAVDPNPNFCNFSAILYSITFKAAILTAGTVSFERDIATTPPPTAARRTCQHTKARSKQRRYYHRLPLSTSSTGTTCCRKSLTRLRCCSTKTWSFTATTLFNCSSTLPTR